MIQRLVSFLILFASASAFAPISYQSRTSFGLFSEFSGEYDGKLWDNEAKKVVYEKWNPNQPRSPLNFNPFETWDGNSPDTNGFYPGEGRYKDPIRGDVSFAIMMAERAEAEQRAAVRICC
jgi:hypothetical protein